PPRPLSSALIPYTTLFRSLLCAAQPLQRYGSVGGVRAGVRTAPNCHRWASTNLGQTAVAIQIDESSAPFRDTDRTRNGADDSSIDRKSTRLNSSHLVISYA